MFGRKKRRKMVFQRVFHPFSKHGIRVETGPIVSFTLKWDFKDWSKPNYYVLKSKVFNKVGSDHIRVQIFYHFGHRLSKGFKKIDPILPTPKSTFWNQKFRLTLKFPFKKRPENFLHMLSSSISKNYAQLIPLSYVQSFKVTIKCEWRLKFWTFYEGQSVFWVEDVNWIPWFVIFVTLYLNI